jgi:hypothetical protein
MTECNSATNTEYSFSCITDHLRNDLYRCILTETGHRPVSTEYVTGYFRNDLRITHYVSRFKIDIHTFSRGAAFLNGPNN